MSLEEEIQFIIIIIVIILKVIWNHTPVSKFLELRKLNKEI